MRTTFGSHLSRGGVPLRTAQAAMRHSDPRLTANVYTDPRLLDVSGALEVLPALPLDAGPETEAQVKTGTDAADLAPRTLAPTLAPKADNRGESQSTADKAKGGAADGRETLNRPETPSQVQNRQALSITDRACVGWACRDLNPGPHGCDPCALAN